MLPLFDASFLFLPPGVELNSAPRKGQWLLELIVCPDEGRPDGGRGDSNPAEFPDPAACHSMIYLNAFIAQKDVQGEWWRNVYQSSNWPEEDEVAETNGQGVCVIGISGDLSSLPDSSAAIALADKLRELVRAQGGSVAQNPG